MAEAGGLSLGALGVAALFNNALECFQQVRVAKDFGRDFETYQCELSLLELRLSQWGAATGISMIKQDGDLQCSTNEKETVRRVLEQIIRLFEDTDKKTKGLSTHSRGVSESDFSDRMKELCGTMKGLSTARMNKAYMVKKDPVTKTKWALFSRDDFNSLMDSISGLVNELIATFSAEGTVKKRTELCDADAVELVQTNKDDVTTLKDALGKDDEQMRGALDRVVAATQINTTSFWGDGNQGLQIGQNSGSMTNSWGGK
jgi:hypothetical protein